MKKKKHNMVLMVNWNHKRWNWANIEANLHKKLTEKEQSQ